jgi:hypothetical protein
MNYKLLIPLLFSFSLVSVSVWQINLTRNDESPGSPNTHDTHHTVVTHNAKPHTRTSCA